MRVGILSLSLCCLTVATPAAAAPVLAEFSRTANARADDGIGTPPADVQSVNNLNRVDPVVAALIDPTATILNDARSYAEANFGHLRVRASAVSRDGVQKTASADSSFQDVLRVAGAGTPGTTYHFAGAFLVEGTTTYSATTGLAVINVGYQWDAYQDSGAIHLGGGAANFERNSTGFGEVGVDFLGTAIPVEFDFLWGSDPIILVLSLGGGAAANSLTSGTGDYAGASVLMGDSLIWLGAAIQTSAGAPLPSTIVGDSGTNWTQAAVPEPLSVSLVAIGLAACAGRAARRRSPVP